jgi:hypothetical protein
MAYVFNPITGKLDDAGTPTTDASLLTSGTLSDSRLSANVPLKDTANTFTTDQTFSGTANTAPNQTAASGSSLMTRDLVDDRDWVYVEKRVQEVPLNAGWTNTTAVSGSVGNFPSSLRCLTSASAGSLATVHGGGNNAQGLSLMLSGANVVLGFGQVDFSRSILFSFAAVILGAGNIVRAYFGTNTLTSNSSTVAGGVGIRAEHNGTNWDIRLLSNSISSGTLISASTNTSPIVLTTTAAHGLSNGDQIEVLGVTGNTAANGIWTVSSASGTTLTLTGSTGNGAYISGGGLHKISSVVTTVNNSQFNAFDLVVSAGTVTLYKGGVSIGSLSGSPTGNLTPTIGFGIFQSTAANQGRFVVSRCRIGIR